MARRLLFPLFALLLALAGCFKPAEPARPALWEVTGPKGEHGWLFGTVHLLSREADWRSATVNRALAGADLLVLEIADIDDDEATRKVFESLAHTPGLPPLSQRVEPELRPALQRALSEAQVDERTFANVETWAAALLLAQLAEQDGKPEYGIDRALVRVTAGMERAELEGAQRQLAIFDGLPEQDQRDLLSAALRDEQQGGSEGDLVEAWRKGDMDRLARETHSGMLSDPELRKALFLERNLAWETRIEALLREKRRPFVAVGALHMAGEDGLPALLAARGWKVQRIQ